MYYYTNQPTRRRFVLLLLYVLICVYVGGIQAIGRHDDICCYLMLRPLCRLF